MIRDKTPVDVTISPGRISCRRQVEAGEGIEFWSTAEEAYLRYEEIGSFSIKRSGEIIYSKEHGVEELLLQQFMIGPVLAVLLSLRGALVLHASAVAGPDGALVFLGSSGWGKSTIAAALYSDGYRFITDDVLPISDKNRAPSAVPGIPQVNIWPEAAQTLGYDPDTLPRLYTGIEKRNLRTDREFSPEPLRIKCIYLIEESDLQIIEPMNRRDAVVETLRHSYCAGILNKSRTAGYFGQCVRLAQTTTFKRLRIKKNLSMLTELTQILTEDVLAGKR